MCFTLNSYMLETYSNTMITKEIGYSHVEVLKNNITEKRYIVRTKLGPQVKKTSKHSKIKRCGKKKDNSHPEAHTFSHHFAGRKIVIVSNVIVSQSCSIADNSVSRLGRDFHPLLSTAPPRHVVMISLSPRFSFES